MLTKSIIAAGALLSVATAIPMQPLNKRDVVWETNTFWDVKTVEMYTTVWLAPGETAPAGAHGPHFGHHHKKPKVTSHIRHTVTVQPFAPSSSPEQSSQYVAPTPSTPAPVESTPSPVESTPAPVESTPAPVESTPAPVESTAAPVESTPAPVESTPAASPTPSSSPKPSPSPKPSSGGGKYPSNGLTGAAAAGTSYTGDFTWYDTGLGACGITSAPSDHIVAISEDLFDQYNPGNPNDNPVCGKTVILTGVDGNKYPAKVVDRCTGCALSDLDLSEDFFNLVTNNGDGRVSGMHWVWE